jgi:hypothetical protein
MSKEVDLDFVVGAIVFISGITLLLIGGGVIVILIIVGGAFIIQDRWWGGFLSLGGGCTIWVAILLDLIHPNQTQLLWLILVSIIAVVGSIIGLLSINSKRMERPQK